MILEKVYSEIVSNMRDGVYFVNRETKIAFWNKAAEDITGYSSDEVIGKKCRETQLTHIDAEGNLICEIGCPLHSTIEDGQVRVNKVFAKHKDGHRIPISVNIYPVMEGASIVGAIEIFMPDSAAIYNNELIERLSDSAMNDHLTGLSNRRKIESFLESRLRDLKLFQNTFCMVFLDIDNFRNFNELYGHDVGDEILVKVSNILKASSREDDIIGRWGGEEFVGIFSIKNSIDAVRIAEKIRVLIEKTKVEKNNISLSVTASLGVTEALSIDTKESITKRADWLMYQSKQGGKNCVTTDVKYCLSIPKYCPDAAGTLSG